MNMERITNLALIKSFLQRKVYFRNYGAGEKTSNPLINKEEIQKMIAELMVRCAHNPSLEKQIKGDYLKDLLDILTDSGEKMDDDEEDDDEDDDGEEDDDEDDDGEEDDDEEDDDEDDDEEDDEEDDEGDDCATIDDDAVSESLLFPFFSTSTIFFISLVRLINSPSVIIRDFGSVTALHLDIVLI